MTSQFVPRDLLASGRFGKDPGAEVEWYLATDCAGAVRLARTVEQHELAFAVLTVSEMNNRSAALRLHGHCHH